MTENIKKHTIQSYEHYTQPKIVPNDNPKHFITFPYCYMNGKLHLGHLFSLSKADYFSRFMKMKGYNSFFPLAFHCTGMPISASALKLEEDINNNNTSKSLVYNILKSYDFKNDEIIEFVDPQKWLNTFPELCKNSLLKFHANIDFSKSFITTDRNVYYNSFIIYQFKRLKKMNYISFGKRYTIYDPKTKQACLDHDRSVGEGVVPIKVDCMKISVKLKGNIMMNLCVRNSCVYKTYIIYSSYDQFFCVDEECYKNVAYQVADIFEIRKFDVVDTFDYDAVSVAYENILNMDFAVEILSVHISFLIKHFQNQKNFKIPENEIKQLDTNNDQESENRYITDNIFRFYEPEELVISRSGAKCVVSYMDQWFLNYNDEKWKVKARKCVENMDKITDETRANLLYGINWIQKWGCSRSFGLGTKLPFDTQYLIESLSDSTIYMAFYTFKDLLFKDIYGDDEIFPANLLCDELWEYIFNYDSEIEGLFDKPFLDHYLDQLPIETASIVRACHKRFMHFYPNDIRFSGKDLTNNHLIFYIMNHCALFEEAYWPKRIFTNGHLLLNSQKMSKSTGNFMTADECIDKYGVSATRMTLAICGDGNEDANFIEENANSFVIRLSILIKSLIDNDQNETVETITEKLNRLYTEQSFDKKDHLVCNDFPITSYTKYSDQFLYESILFNFKNAIISYEKLLFRDVIKYAFYEMLNAKDTFIQLHGTLESTVMKLWRNTIITLLYPIIPTLCDGIMRQNVNLKYINIPENEICCEHPFSIIAEIEYLKKIVKRIKFMIKKRKLKSIKIGVGKEYSSMKQDLMNCEGNLEEINKLLINMKVGKEKADCILFAMDYWKNKEAYKPVNEVRVINECKEYLEKIFMCHVCVEGDECGDPLAPVITIEYK